MTVEFTSDAENKRIKRENSPTWALFSSTSLVKTLKTAQEMGWKEGKIQVRQERTTEDSFTYLIEPNDNCGCKGILRYSDYFD